MLDLIKNLFLFRNIEFESVCKKYDLAERIEISEFYDGQTVMNSSDGHYGVFVVLEGSGYISSVSKKHIAPLRYLTKGDTFGAASLYGTPTVHRTQVIAKDYMKTAVLPADFVTLLIENETRIAFNYITFLSDRVSFLNRKIAAFSAGSAEEKLALYLLSLPHDDETLILTESYTYIAKALDIGRASLYRAIETLENEKIIRKSGKHIYIDDRNMLLQMIK